MPVRLTAFPSDGPALRRVFREGGVYLIGRGADCDLALADPAVSRQHARLAGDEAGWRLEDLASKNGTRLDGRVIASARLDGTAWLSLGGVSIFLETIDTDAAKRETVVNRHRERRARFLDERLRQTQTYSELLEACLDGALELGACKRGSIWFRSADNQNALALRRGSEEPPESRGVIDSVFATGAAVLSHDVEGVEALARRQSILLGGVRALICLPLAVSGTVHGVIYADSRTPGKIFTELDIALLKGLADHAALTLAAVRLRGEILALGLTAPERAAAADDPGASGVNSESGPML